MQMPMLWRKADSRQPEPVPAHLPGVLTELGVEIALGHLGHVVLMQELALVPFFA